MEATREGEKDKQFQAWKEKMGDEVKIGEEGEAALMEEIKDIYRRLIIAYKEVIAENPKKLGIIPGIYVYHGILHTAPRRRQTMQRQGQRWGTGRGEDQGGRDQNALRKCHRGRMQLRVVFKSGGSQKEGRDATHMRGSVQGQHGHKV